MAKLSAPGLRKKVRKNGPPVYYWEPWPAAKALGFGPQSLRRPDGSAMDEGEAYAAARAINSELEARRAGKRAPAPATPRDHDFAAAIAAYRASKAFCADIADATRRMYDHELKSIAADFGDIDVRVFTLADARAYLDKIKSKSVRSARGRVLRLLLSFAADQPSFDLAFNPLLSSGRQRGLRLAAPAVRVVDLSYAGEAALIAAARKLEAWGVLLAIYAGTCLGQRITDILVLSETQRGSDGLHRFVQSKTRGRDEPVEVYIPFYLPRLKAALDAELARRKALSPPLIDPRWILNPWDRWAPMKPYTLSTFDHHFAAVREEAAKTCPECAGVQFRDLRDTFVTRCQDAGCTPVDVCAITGHVPRDVPATWRHYLKRKPQHARRCLETLMTYEASLGVSNIEEEKT